MIDVEPLVAAVAEGKPLTNDEARALVRELERLQHLVILPRRTLLSISRAAAIAGVSRRTIYNWLDRGMIEFVKTQGGASRVYEDSLFRKTEKGPSHHE